MKFLLFPLKLIAFLIYFPVILCAGAVTLPMTLINGIFRWDLKAELNEWWVVIKHMFNQAYECLL